MRPGIGTDFSNCCTAPAKALGSVRSNSSAIMDRAVLLATDNTEPKRWWMPSAGSRSLRHKPEHTGAAWTRRDVRRPRRRVRCRRGQGGDSARHQGDPGGREVLEGGEVGGGGV